MEHNYIPKKLFEKKRVFLKLLFTLKTESTLTFIQYQKMKLLPEPYVVICYLAVDA